jgi:hypothetical protein
MERFEYHVFHGHQVFLHLLVRRQHDDLRKHTAGIMPSCAQVVQEVRRVVCAWDAEIEENQRGAISRWHGPVYPGEGGLPTGTSCRTIPRKLKRPAEQFLDSRVAFGDQDVRRSRDSVCPWKRCTPTWVSITSHHTASFLLRETRTRSS